MHSNSISRFLILYARTLAATHYAKQRQLPGIEFAYYGRQLGYKMLLKRASPSISYVLTPVSSTRYFEFTFAYESLPIRTRRCLDISSPSLFSFFVASKRLNTNIRMINPDRADCLHTQSVITNCGLKNVDLDVLDLRSALSDGRTYDCIWTLSVVEHIAGQYDDRYAVQAMYEALEPGGRMIITIPVDRFAWDEYREQDAYGIQDTHSDGRYFFQRHYTENSIWERLVAPIGQNPTLVRWFGETLRGRFADYEQRWLKEGYDCTVDDPREIVNFYREFSSWSEMPGEGVCGLMFVKN